MGDSENVCIVGGQGEEWPTLIDSSLVAFAVSDRVGVPVRSTQESSLIIAVSVVCGLIAVLIGVIIIILVFLVLKHRRATLDLRKDQRYSLKCTLTNSNWWIFSNNSPFSSDLMRVYCIRSSSENT